MTLPRQIQQVNEEIEQLESQLRAKEETPTPEESVTPEEEQTNTVESEDTFDESAEEGQQPSGEAVSDEPLWETRYKHLEGKYRAEVPRLHNEVKELKALIDQMRASAEQSQQQKEPVAEKFVTPEDIESYGEELIDLQRRVAREVSADFKQELDRLYKENEQLKQQVQAVHGSSFEAQLSHVIPDWTTLNQNPEWIAWLDTFDPMIQGPRRAVAQEAYNRGDIQAIKTYVDIFRQMTKRPKKIDRQSELRKQIQPQKANVQTPPATQGQVYTTAEAESIFNQIQHFINKGNMDEAARLEGEISAAYTEGRVTG